MAPPFTPTRAWDMTQAMTANRDPLQKPPRPSAAALREERLKAALKANVARRKAQAKARSDGAVGDADGTEQAE